MGEPVSITQVDASINTNQFTLHTPRAHILRLQVDQIAEQTEALTEAHAALLAAPAPLTVWSLLAIEGPNSKLSKLRTLLL
jgi:hypothetical protein